MAKAQPLPSLQTLEHAFWAQVRRCRHGQRCQRCCWEWQNRGKPRTDYGHLSYPGLRTPLVAHRFVLELLHGALLFPFPNFKELATRGPQPMRFIILHRCDNPPCVNPSHLVIGTQFDNMRDAKRKGRLRSGGKPQAVPHA